MRKTQAIGIFDPSCGYLVGQEQKKPGTDGGLVSGGVVGCLGQSWVVSMKEGRRLPSKGPAWPCGVSLTNKAFSFVVVLCSGHF